MADLLRIFKIVMTSVFKKPACDMYPFKKPHFYPNTKGAIRIDAPKCILCTLCDKRCPTGAISVDKAGRTWTINHYKCILCNVCVEVCPKKCLLNENQYAAPNTEKELELVNIPMPAPKEVKAEE